MWPPFHRDTSMCCRIPIVRGRAFTDRDVMGATPVVIINQAMARRYWPARTRLQRLSRTSLEFPDVPTFPWQIIGIAGRRPYYGLSQNRTGHSVFSGSASSGRSQCLHRAEPHGLDRPHLGRSWFAQAGDSARAHLSERLAFRCLVFVPWMRSWPNQRPVDNSICCFSPSLVARHCYLRQLAYTD